ncbi:MAG: hypothetical protein LBR49_08640 [Tannerella sp.]|nr:hypothetical protein [Tannerella sp.]
MKAAPGVHERALQPCGTSSCVPRMGRAALQDIFGPSQTAPAALRDIFGPSRTARAALQHIFGRSRTGRAALRHIVVCSTNGSCSTAGHR